MNKTNTYRTIKTVSKSNSKSIARFSILLGVLAVRDRYFYFLLLFCWGGGGGELFPGARNIVSHEVSIVSYCLYMLSGRAPLGRLHHYLKQCS